MLVKCISKKELEENSFIGEKELKEYGFIHTSFTYNFKEIASKFEKEKDNYVLLLLRETKIDSNVVIENGFAYVQGLIDKQAIIEIKDFDYYKVWDKYKIVNYKRKLHLDSTALLIQRTWPYYYKLFKNLTDSTDLYHGLVDISDLSCDYQKVIVDDKNTVLAMFFAATNTKRRTSTIFKKIRIYLKYYYKVHFKKSFGEIPQAKKAIKEYIQLLEGISKKHEKRGSELELFITDPSLQSMGYGKKLMSDFILYIKDKGKTNMFLMTDLGCNYHFYENYGFTRVDEFHSEYLEGKEKDENGFVYSKKL